ncbi:lysylphosphatidylglycerol synthase domain-containing protein [Candidatus Poriferisodalis sp.]|uniref:lysylphosphatidylglycerol synthase domain-containing protein n=1 Tax=Candidatus Poriferisodalis sp. TaxID=3101277 RepID=UPI003B026335
MSYLRATLSRRTGALVVAAVTVVAVVFVVRATDGAALGAAWRRAASEPFSVAVALSAFGAAFMMRAVAWRRVLPTLSFGQSLAGIHLALGGNHVLPLRLGEALRVVSVVRRTPISTDAAVASSLTLRTADTLALLGWGLAVSPVVLVAIMGTAGWLLMGAGVAVIAAGLAWWWLRASVGGRSDVRPPGLAALGLSALAWPAEAVLVHEAAHWAGLEISAAEAVGVTALSVIAQIVAIAPGGFGTYEAAAVAAYVAFGYDPAAALVAALTAHALKTAYSIVAGGVAAAVPAPGVMSARLRARSPDGERRQQPTGGPVSDRDGELEQHVPGDAASLPPAGERPLVVLFMPAFNEEASVGDCVRRAPASVLGCDVEVLVVDDGSADATAERARAAGATVISLAANQGLGNAVRVGLAAGAERGAAAVVFCDADGEYAPEELPTLVAPILAGTAHYVVGSRLGGQIEVMKPHRRFGNVVLTLALSLVARRRISDGQSGYRALSLDAARHAEIIHDFNYAQVLTLDLLDKGYRYAEVPISYRFRTTGDSFIKLGRYLRHVVPAVTRELTVGRCTTVSETSLDKATIL